MIETLNMFSFIGGSGEAVLNPIYEGLSLIGPYALSVVLVLSIFYGIFTYFNWIFFTFTINLNTKFTANLF